MDTTLQIPTNNLRSIVAATDLSANAAPALEWAQEIAVDHQARLHIVNASKLAGWSTDYLEIDARIPPQIRSATRDKLEDLAKTLRQRGIQVSCEVCLGEPCDIILATAEARQADLIVVGTRGQRGLDYLLLGSTAQRVVQRAPSPVLTVHPQDAENQRPIRKVLVATDFSVEAESALTAALDLFSVSPTDIEIILLHAYLVPYDLVGTEGVVSAAAGLEQWQTAQADVEQRLDSWAEPLRALGMSVQILGFEGYPPEIIIDKAQDNGVDLIVMGTHGRTGLRHVLLGSTAERVIHRASCPVLTVRRSHRD